MFDPSYTIPAKAQWMAREPKTQQSLNIQLNKLNEISNNIDSYSIQEIKSALKNTALLVNLSNKELNSQYEAWLSIKGVMEKDRKVFDKIRNEINNVEGMKEKQVLAVQEIIERNKNENVIGSFFTGITTFFLGVISSILGTIILKKYNKQISNLFFR
jgi:hypothetical protein